jgi:hypothetical protein
LASHPSMFNYTARKRESNRNKTTFFARFGIGLITDFGQPQSFSDRNPGPESYITSYVGEAVFLPLQKNHGNIGKPSPSIMFPLHCI